MIRRLFCWATYHTPVLLLGHLQCTYCKRVLVTVSYE